MGGIYYTRKESIFSKNKLDVTVGCFCLSFKIFVALFFSLFLVLFFSSLQETEEHYI